MKMNSNIGSCANCGDNLTIDHKCPPWENQGVGSGFDTLSKKCPWRRELKCLVIHTAREYGTDGCNPFNCGFYYWKNRG